MIKITGLSLAMDNVEKELEQQVRNAQLAMGNVGEDVVGRLQDEVQKLELTDLGAYNNSLSHETSRQGSNVVTEVFSNELHALYIEFGRRPGKTPPPLQALMGWAARHNFFSVLKVNSSVDSYTKELSTAFAILKNKKTGGRKPKKKKPLDPLVLDLVRLISLQRSIAKNGTKGRFIFTKILEKEQKILEDHFLQYYKL